MVIEEFAYAKLNLRLKVIGRREDGYHMLSMLNVLIPLRDELRAEVNNQAGGDSSDAASLQIDNGGDLSSHPGAAELQCDNLVLRAARRFFEHYPQLGSVHFRLLKRIPLLAGLGGGSSDAAAALRLLSRAFGVPLLELEQIALDVGADVPFFLSRQPFAFVGGIGGQILALPQRVLSGLGALIVKPPIGLSTAAVFAELRKRDSRDFCADQQCAAFVAAVQGLAAEADPCRDRTKTLQATLLQLIENDLERIAVNLSAPIATLLEHLRCAGKFSVALSGSGSSVFAVFDLTDQAASGLAANLARDLKKDGMLVNLCRLGEIIL